MNSLFIYGLIIISAVAKAAMDKLQFHFYESIFCDLKHEFWNADVSWTNKWKKGNKNLGEKFFLSSTILVFLTDGWHLMQFIFLNTIFLVIFAIGLHDFTISQAIIHTIILRGIFGLFFELFFKHVFSKNL